MPWWGARPTAPTWDWRSAPALQHASQLLTPRSQPVAASVSDDTPVVRERNPERAAPREPAQRRCARRAIALGQAYLSSSVESFHQLWCRRPSDSAAITVPAG
jgi:hypothetical protein